MNALREEKPKIIIRTQRLIIRKAGLSDEDVNLFYNLWTDPKVMIFVGFPKGLNITKEDIINKIKAEDESEYNCKLLVIHEKTNRPIGECKLGYPDKDGISDTDVKLLPQYWGKGFGKEIKIALVDYLFNNTNCKAVSASPNKLNIASQKMQEAVGGKRIDEGVYVFPEKMKAYTTDVPYYTYMVYREDWEISK